MAQHQFDNWYFGNHAGLSFATSPPAPLLNSKINTFEGCASISDETSGQLLFYTDGITVWDRSGAVMPNGFGLQGDASSTQSALIVRNSTDSDQYYIFTADEIGALKPNRGISYSLVDMRLQGGFGDVTVKNQSLLSNATEKLTAVRNGCESWILAHQFNSNAFYAFHLGYNGLETTPVISTVGNTQMLPIDNGIGYLVSSADGSMIAQACYGANSNYAELFHFDALTGKLFDPILIPNLRTPYGCAFSPDNTKLYVTSTNKGLVQYDVMIWDSLKILASEKTIYNSQFDLKSIIPGPDGKLYLARSSSFFVGAINDPNKPGTQCDFNPTQIQLKPNSSAAGLPNIPASFIGWASSSCYGFNERISSVTTTCAGSCVNIRSSGPQAKTYRWTFERGIPATSQEQNPIVCFQQAGDHRIDLQALDAQGNESLDSFIIHIDPVETIRLSSENIYNDTIGAIISIPLFYNGPAPLVVKSFQFTVHFDPEYLLLDGFYDNAGNKLSQQALDSNKIALSINNIILDTANGGHIGEARFVLYPKKDSCTAVQFSDLELTTPGNPCTTLADSEITATICTGNTCGASLISSFMQSGKLPIFSVASIERGALLIHSDQNIPDAELILYNATGTSVYRSVASLETASPLLLTPHVKSGVYFLEIHAGTAIKRLPVTILR